LRSIVSAAQNEEKENTQQRGTKRDKDKRIVGGTLQEMGDSKIPFQFHPVARHEIYYKAEGDGFPKPELR
jgi:hypothetical protein